MEWVHDDGVELTTLLFEKQMGSARNDAGHFLLAIAEQKEGRVFIATLTEKIKLLQAAKKNQIDAIAAIRRKILESRAESKKLEKTLGGSRIKEPQHAIEGILHQHVIDRGAHHCGNLVGGCCRLVMAEAKAIFTEIEVLLLGMIPRNAGRVRRDHTTIFPYNQGLKAM